MNSHQNGFTLGSLLRIIALLSLIAGAIVAYNKWQLNAQIGAIELILIDTKARIENSLALDDDVNITIGEAVNKAQESAKNIDESIIQLKKLDHKAGKEHQEKGLKILMASRDLMRIQAKMILNHAENRFQAGKMESMMEEIVGGKDMADLSAVDHSAIAELLAKARLLKANLDVITFERAQALSNLTAATNEAKHLFTEKALINADNYLAATQEPDRLRGTEN